MTFPYVGLALTPGEFTEYVNHYNFGSIPPDFVVLHQTAIPAASYAPAGDPKNFWDANESGLSATTIKAKRLKRLAGVRDFYATTLGWSAGPHLFVDERFIYLMSPMYNPGIHAKWGNSFKVAGKLHYSIGIEVIGCFDRVAWPAPVAMNVRSAVQTLQRRLKTFSLEYLYPNPALKPGRATKVVNGATIEYCPHPERLKWGGLSSHRDYNKPGCPGAAITEAFYLNAIRG